MRKSITVLVSAFVAVLALGAFAASSAFANPEFLHCEKVTSGEPRYTSKENCEKLVSPGTTGEWGWTSAGELEIVNITSGVSHFNGIVKVECEDDIMDTSVIHKITGPMTSKAAILFLKCHVQGSTALCNSTGMTEGKILTKVLVGTLGYITNPPAANRVGMIFEAESGDQADFTCAGFPETKVTGGIVGEYTEASLNKMQKTFVLKFECESVGSSKQKVQTIELLPATFMEKVHLVSGGLESCEETTETIEIDGEGLIMS